VTDLERSAAYYRDVLGFRISWEDGTNWRLAERDGVRLMLGHCPNQKPATEIFPHDWFGYLETEDVDALRAEFVGRGAQCSEPKEQPYGMREIVVTTVDGHRIVFGQEGAPIRHLRSSSAFVLKLNRLVDAHLENGRAVCGT
jgi:catechol 2,3-dioxygenase-like lactoylglutathione lyase family enzyme